MLVNSPAHENSPPQDQDSGNFWGHSRTSEEWKKPESARGRLAGTGQRWGHAASSCSSLTTHTCPLKSTESPVSHVPVLFQRDDGVQAGPQCGTEIVCSIRKHEKARIGLMKTCVLDKLHAVTGYSTADREFSNSESTPHRNTQNKVLYCLMNTNAQEPSLARP